MSQSLASDIQQVLAHLLQCPSRQLMPLVKQVLSDRPKEQQNNVFWATRQVIADTLKAPLAKDTEHDVPPILVDRLKFAWAVFGGVESRIGTLSEKDVPTITNVAFLRELFQGVIAVPEIDNVLLEQICICMHLGSAGRFLKSYRSVVKAQRPKRVPLPIRDEFGRPNIENVRRLIFWLIRKRRERYVDVDVQSPFAVHFEFLVDQVLSALIASCDATLQSIPKVNEEVENTINEWLDYNCLNGDTAPESEAERRLIAVAFVKGHRLKDRIHTRSPVSDPLHQKKIDELERSVALYAEENRRLEQLVAELRHSSKPAATNKHESPAEPASSRDLSDILKLIDSKYSLDTLHAIQLGESSSISIKNFVSHLFYVLRKKGVSTYPDIDTFELHYEDSGLYSCQGFQIEPGDRRRVEVVKKGWGIRSKDRLFPIRFAQLKLVDTSAS